MSGLRSSSANAEYSSARSTSSVHYFDQLLNIPSPLIQSEPFQSSMANHPTKWIDGRAICSIICQCVIVS
eukprot:8837814-Ditylum_brightwellii.AAC.1